MKARDFLIVRALSGPGEGRPPPVRHAARRHCARRLLRKADLLAKPRDELVIALRPLTDAELAEAKLALDLAARPGLAFRALVEGWDQARVVREVY